MLPPGKRKLRWNWWVQVDLLEEEQQGGLRKVTSADLILEELLDGADSETLLAMPSPSSATASASAPASSSTAGTSQHSFFFDLAIACIAYALVYPSC